VALPPGDAGIIVGRDPPTIVQVDPTSLLKDKLRVGLVVDSVELDDGNAIYGHTAEEITDILKVSKGEQRTLILKDPNSTAVSERSIKFPNQREVDIPAGDLGVVFKGSLARVAKISDASPVRRKFRMGMIADSLLLPDGTKYSGLSAEQLTGILANSVDVTSKTLSKVFTTKVTLPSGDLGLAFDGEPAIITKVSEESCLKNRMYAGQMVKTVRLEEGTEYDDLDWNDVQEILNDMQDSTARWMLLENRKPIIPLPGEKLVYLPSTRLGVNFNGKPPTIVGISKDSQVANEFMVGLVADTVIVPGHPTYVDFTSDELDKILENTVAIQGRVIRLKNPSLESSSTSDYSTGACLYVCGVPVSGKPRQLRGSSRRKNDTIRATNFHYVPPFASSALQILLRRVAL
jgi:hypothetical protein